MNEKTPIRETVPSYEETVDEAAVGQSVPPYDEEVVVHRPKKCLQFFRFFGLFLFLALGITFIVIGSLPSSPILDEINTLSRITGGFLIVIAYFTEAAFALQIEVEREADRYRELKLLWQARGRRPIIIITALFIFSSGSFYCILRSFSTILSLELLSRAPCPVVYLMSSAFVVVSSIILVIPVVVVFCIVRCCVNRHCR
jgi:hypothetical protein